MATPTLAEDHQGGQEALLTLVPAVMRQAWPLLDPHDIQGTLPRFLAAVKAIVAKYGQASSAAALAYYQQERAAAGVVGRAPLKVAPRPPDKTIEDAIGWAASDLYGAVTPESEQAALDRVSEAATQLVLDQGRSSIIDTVRADQKAKGWVRVTEQGACSFCIMLALRGATYKSQRAAEFKAHDRCRCHVEAIFTAYEPSHRMRELQRLWTEATKGRSGHDARVAFRQAVEGRPVTGATQKATPKPRAEARRADDLARYERLARESQNSKIRAHYAALAADLRKQN